MIVLLSWPFVGPEWDVPLDLVAFPLEGGEMDVVVKRGAENLTGEAVSGGNQCLYRGGMWTVRKSGPDVLESVTRRNASVKDVVAFILADMQSHSVGYRIPPEVLEEALSMERMEELCLAARVMLS